jgi:hypothetical protein
MLDVRIEMHVGLHEICSLFLSDLNCNWNVLTNVCKIPKYGTAWKSVHLLQFFRAHWRMDGQILTADPQGCERA